MRRLSAEELMLSNCGSREDSWEFCGLQEIKLLNPKGNQSWIFIGRNDAEAPILWRSDVKKRLIGKVPDAGKDWGQKEREWQKMRWLNSFTNWTDVDLSKLLDTVEGREVWLATVHGVAKSWTWLSDNKNNEDNITVIPLTFKLVHFLLISKKRKEKKRKSNSL